MAPRRSAPRPIQFKLGVANLRVALARAEAKADKAVAAGTKRLIAAKKRGDLKAVADDLAALANAKKARGNLGASVHLMALACCDQTLNCDPSFF